MKKLLAVLLILLLAAPPVLTFAGEPKDHICFRIVDADHDGEVTVGEFEKYFGNDPEKFKAVDTDGNGSLSHDEYHDFLGGGAL